MTLNRKEKIFQFVFAINLGPVQDKSAQEIRFDQYVILQVYASLV